MAYRDKKSNKRNEVLDDLQPESSGNEADSILGTSREDGLTMLGILIGALASLLTTAISDKVTFEAQLKHIIPTAGLFLIAVMVVLGVFTFLLKRQPSKVTKLKKSLTQAYLGALESSPLAPASLRNRHNA